MKEASIIIPAYNAARTLDFCLSSIAALDYPHESFEIIVVDNNSKDETQNIVGKYPGVKYLVEKNQGRSHARNLGARFAEGKYLVFVDADVYLDSQWLKNSLQAIDRESVAGGQGAIIPSTRIGKASLNNYRYRQQDESTCGTFNILNMSVHESPMINSAACIYKKDIFFKVGGFDIQLERHEDIDLSKRILYAGFDLAIIENSLAHVIYHGKGWSSYFLRSYEEGVTKPKYLSKWAQLPSSESSTNSLNFMTFIDEVCFNTMRAVLKFDSFFLLKAVNSCFKSLGRIVGSFGSKYNETLVLTRLNHDREYRYVYQGNKIIYVFDINLNGLPQSGATISYDHEAIIL